MVVQYLFTYKKKSYQYHPKNNLEVAYLLCVLLVNFTTFLCTVIIVCLIVCFSSYPLRVANKLNLLQKKK